MRDQDQVVYEQFHGYYKRGMEDAVPPNKLINALNVVYNEGEVGSRPGLESLVTLSASAGNLVRFFVYEKSDGTRYVYIDHLGDVYDTGSATPNTPILTFPTGTDFYCLNLNDKLFITPHDRETGLDSEFVYIYNGTGTARKAAGNGPTSGSITAANGAAGKIQAGLHLIAVVFETDSGHITNTGTIAYTQFTATGNLKCDLSTIPTGPAGTSARHILVSKVIIGYDGNQENYELFFLPSGGRIADNVTTTLTIDFYDSELLDSADYLKDQLAEIPASLGLAVYLGSLVTWGEFDNPHIARVSPINTPESFDEVNGFIECYQGDGGGIDKAFEMRGTLYLFKDNRAFATTSDGNPPIDWAVNYIDNGLGAKVFSVGEIRDSSGSIIDLALVGNSAGLFPFNGSFPETPLSQDIEDFWNAISDISQMEIAVDSKKKRIYCIAREMDSVDEEVVPGTVDFIAVCDYKRGMAPEKVKWSLFFANKAVHSEAAEIRSIQVDDTNLIVGVGELEGGNTAKRLFRLDDTKRGDWSGGSNIGFNNFQASVDLPLTKFDDQGGVCNFIGTRVRAIGSGPLEFSVSGLDDVGSSQVGTITLASAPGKEQVKKFNFKNEALKLNFYIEDDPVGTEVWFRVKTVRVFGKSLWISRPE